MSPTVNNFVHDLVAMAKAMEDLPIVQAQLNEVNNHLIQALDQVQRLELKLIDAHTETDKVRSDLRKAEEDRDEATRAFLEADDRTDKAVAFVRSLMGNAQSLIEAVEPKVQVATQPVQGQSEVDPTSAPTQTSQYEQRGETSHSPEHDTSVLIVENTSIDPGPAFGTGFILHGDPSNIDSVSTGPVEVATTDPTHGASMAHPEQPVDIISVSNDATPQDDVGYHNEPTISGDLSWRDWDTWAERMNRRYGAGSWPARQLHQSIAQ